MLSRLTLVLIPVILVAAACQEPLGRCEESVLPTCDAHDADCQRALHEHVACVRGGDLDSEPPSFEFISAYDYHARYDRLPDPPLDRQQCLYLTTLWPAAGQTLDVAEPTARFDVDRRIIVVVDDADPKAVQVPLLRAIAQAQRDVELDGFAAWRAEHGLTLDERTALETLFAGEGRLFGDAAALKTKAMSDEAFRDLVDDELDDYENAEADFFNYARSRRYDYRYAGLHFDAAGARFALKTFLAGDRAALARAYERPVWSTAELARGRLTDAAPLEPKTDYFLPPGYVHRAPDRLGAWAYFTFLSRVDPLDLSAELERRERYHGVAGRWRGDRFDCAIDDGTGFALVMWELAWDDGVEFDLFTMTRNAPGTWRWLEDDTSLFLVGGDDPNAVEQVIEWIESNSGE